jgi:hypothetical protein
MDGVDVAGLVAAASTALAGLGVWLRRRRKRAGSFRPRARVRAYLSFRTHRNSAKAEELEPGPFDEERDTGKHHRAPDADK